LRPFVLNKEIQDGTKVRVWNLLGRLPPTKNLEIVPIVCYSQDQLKHTLHSSEYADQPSMFKEECDPIINMNKENKQSSIRDNVIVFQK
jgi:hypothetical protein